MTTLDVLKAARALISDERAWTQGAEARFRDGAPAWAENYGAVQWAAQGAVSKALNEAGIYDGPARSAMVATLFDVLHQGTAGQPVTTYNDTHTHAEVLALFDAAIKRLEQEVSAC